MRFLGSIYGLVLAIGILTIVYDGPALLMGLCLGPSLAGLGGILGIIAERE